MRDYEYLDLYFDSHLDKQMKIEVLGTGITIDNSMIELDAFELDEMLCSEQELIFGSCEANCVKFTARDMPGSIVGKTIRITETVDGNTDVPLQYGIYKVYSDVPSSDRTKREITAYDAMYDIVNADVKSWYAGLSFPMTLRQFRDSFFAYFGIVQKETALVNDGMSVNKTLVAEPVDPESTIAEESEISGGVVITSICEINGVFGNINRDGEFEYVELKEIVHPLYPANDLYPSDDLFPRDPNTISMTGHYITFDYEDFQTKQITQLEIRPSDDSVGTTAGTSGNTYVISGNFLLSDKTGEELEAIAANMLSVIRKAAYTPIKSSAVVGNPCIELGDPIRFNTTREIIESYVLQRTLTGIQNKRDSIVSQGKEKYSKNPNSIRDQISSVERRTNKLERTADHTLSEIRAVDTKVDDLGAAVKSTASELNSKIEQTASSITSEVNEKVTQIDNDISDVNGRVDAVDGKVDNLSASVNESVTEMNSKIEQTASSIRSEVSKSIAAVDSNAQSYADEAEGNAVAAAAASTDEKLKKYSTTAEMKNVVEQTAESTRAEISKTVSDNYATKTEAKGYADSARDEANSYTDGAKDSAIASANGYTDGKLVDYTKTTEMSNIIESTAESTKQEITKTVSEGYSTKSEAQGYADAAEGNAVAAANGYTDGKLTDYSTTTEMRAEIDKSASGITQTVSKTYSTKTEAQGYASVAESNANASTDEKLKSYATTEELSSQMKQTADQIQTEVINRQNADTEMSTRISQTAHSIGLTATGGDNSVGITVQLYDENGNLIDTESGNANINIVGFVTFSDLSGNGTTSINGANILTGTISADKLIAGALTAGRVETSDGKTIIDSGQFVVTDGRIQVQSSTANSNIQPSQIYTPYLYAGNTVYSAGSIHAEGSISCEGGFEGNATSANSATYATYAEKCNNSTTNSHTANCFITSAMTIYQVPSGSARRFKTDIEQVVDANLDPHRLYDVKVVQFKYKPSFYNLPEGTEMPTVIGMLADDIDQIYPCACEYDEETGEVINWLERYMIPPMLALIQEQHKDIESLKQENLALQNRVSILEQRMEELENVINNKINQS